MRLLYWINFLSSVGYNAVSKILPAFLTVFTSSAFLIGSVNSAYQLGKTVNTVFSGYVIDRFDKKKAIMITFFLIALLALSLNLANSIYFFIAVFFAVGVVSQLYHLEAITFASIFSPRKAESISRLEASYQIGFVLGPMIGGLLALYFNMHLVFIFWTVVSLIGLFSAKFFRHAGESKAFSIKETFQPLLKLVRQNLSGFLVFLLVGSFFVGLIEGVRDIIIPLYALDLGFNIFDIGIIFTVSALITALGIIPLGRISDAKGRYFSLVLGLVLIALAFFALQLSNSLLLLAALTGILSLGRTIGLTTARAFAADMVDVRFRGSGLSIFELFFGFGRVIGPIMGGLLKDVILARSTMLLFAVVSAIVVLLLVVFWLVKKR